MQPPTPSNPKSSAPSLLAGYGEAWEPIPAVTSILQQQRWWRRRSLASVEDDPGTLSSHPLNHTEVSSWWCEEEVPRGGGIAWVMGEEIWRIWALLLTSSLSGPANHQRMQGRRGRADWFHASEWIDLSLERVSARGTRKGERERQREREVVGVGAGWLWRWPMKIVAQAPKVPTWPPPHTPKTASFGNTRAGEESIGTRVAAELTWSTGGSPYVPRHHVTCNFPALGK